jgi:hypothetical protein
VTQTVPGDRRQDVPDPTSPRDDDLFARLEGTAKLVLLQVRSISQSGPRFKTRLSDTSAFDAGRRGNVVRDARTDQ